ncbi:MAG: mevalonate kinase [Bacteroidetes bacterium]|nr:mevalonate kinase [Bacteroidota bacterium]
MEKVFAEASAPGKVILIGDQFVIQGVPAVLSALPYTTTCRVELLPDRLPGWKMDDQRTEVPGYKQAKLKDQKEAMDIMISELKLIDKSIKVILSGNLLAGSGVGASAANCVSFIRACNDLFDLNLTDRAINYFSWRGEFGYHGLPSGLDNTVSTFGGTIYYHLIGDKKSFEPLNLKKPVEVVMGNSGITANTAKLKGFLEEQRDSNPNLYYQRLDSVQSQVQELRLALEAFDLRSVGRIMSENHKLLIEMGLSHPRLVELCGIAESLGAYGAKVTGGGRGGFMVALTPGRELQETVAAAFEEMGVSTIRGMIG